MFNSIVKKCKWVNNDIGLLVLRIGFGAVFILAGWEKVSHLQITVGMFAQMGFNAFWTYIVSFTEFIGGIAIILGAWTRLAAALLAITMLVAVYVVHNNINMVMTPFILFFAAFSLFLSGGGKYSLVARICGCSTCPACIDADVAPKA